MSLNEFAPLSSVVVKHVREAFVGPDAIEREWRDLNFTSSPDFTRALDEYDQFLEVIASSGAEVRQLPRGVSVGLDAIYPRDASIVTPAGMVICRMVKPQRAGEPLAQVAAYRDWNLPIAGVIEAPGTLEGGDVLWLDERTLVVGRGYRTNDAGILQLRGLVGSDVDVIVVPLPHWRGAGDVFHLMSVMSPVDADLAVVYSPLLAVPFRELLVDRGYELIEVPDEEFSTMGANVLAVGPRRVVMLDGNPVTRAKLEGAGADVRTYSGVEISLKGGGGPTCLTRPIQRRT